MSRLFRCAILSVSALILLASALPCPPVEKLTRKQPSAAQTNGESAKPAAWRAALPCQCQATESASLAGGMLGFALISIATTSDLAEPSVAQVAPVAEVPPAPYSAVDPIPI